MIDAVYFAIASAAGALGAVVGFGIQVRNLKKSQLEIEELRRKAARAEQESEKLRLELQDLVHRVELTRLGREKTELEIGKLRREGAPKSRLVTEVSTEEILRFTETSSQRQLPAPASRSRHFGLFPVVAIVLAVGAGGFFLSGLPNSVITIIQGILNSIFRETR